MKKIMWIFWIVVFVLLVVFAMTLSLENDNLVEVSYYGLGAKNVSVFILLIIPFFIGLLLGVVITSFSVFKYKRRCSIEKRKLAKVEKEVENLRALPLKDEV